MSIYILAFGLSIAMIVLLSCHRDECSVAGIQDRNRPYFPYIVAAVPLVLVSGLRFNVGTDYFNTYYTGFYRILNGIYFDHFEIGYLLLNQLIQCFTDNAFVMIFITAGITVGFTFAAFRSLSSNVAFSVLLFLISRYYFIGMNAVRQMMACAIFAYGLKFAIKRDLKRYLLFSAIAVSFHYSTVFLVPIYWLMNIEWNKTRITTAFILSSLAGLIAFPVLTHILPSVSKWGIILNSFGVAGQLFTLGTILLNAFILSLYYLAFQKGKNNPWYKCFLTLQIFACMITLFLPTVPVAERVYWSFSFPAIIALPGILKMISVEWERQLGTMILVIVLVAYTVYDIGVLKDHQVVPYDTIIGHECVQSTDFAYRQNHGLDWWKTR